MKSPLRITALLVAGALSIGTASAGFFAPNWFTDADGTIQFYKSNGTTKLDNSFKVEVGVFATTPTAANFTTDAFTVLGTTSWDANIIDTNVGGATLSFSWNSVIGYPTGATAGQQIYAWIYDSKANVVTSNWALITNPSWTLQTIPSGAGVSGPDWTITQAGTQYLVGTLSGNKVTLAIPEPATYAVIFGLATLGFVAIRRFRR